MQKSFASKVNQLFVKTVPPYFRQGAYLSTNSGEIGMTFLTSPNNSRYVFDENIKIRFVYNKDNGLVTVTVDEKNSRKPFLINNCKFDVQITSFQSFFVSLLKGYVKLGEATINFYDSLGKY